MPCRSVAYFHNGRTCQILVQVSENEFRLLLRHLVDDVVNQSDGKVKTKSY